MALALFDLDNTLLNGDSDYEWGQFLVRKQLVNAEAYEQANITFYEDYKRGELDIVAFSAFTFKPLTQFSEDMLKSLHDEFMQTVIKPRLSTASRDLVEKHREQSDTLVIITATNSFITGPIAVELNIPHLIATEPKKVNGKYTTEIDGIPCFQEGKITRLNAWLKENNVELTGATFYSDSRNDLPLLELVDKPVAANPDDTLKEIAEERSWPIIYLHE